MSLRRSTNLSPVQLARRVEIGKTRRVKTKQKLLDAAYRLFAAHGADVPTIDDVIAAAQVARGTFYNHFTTRDELFKAVADDIADSINALIAPQLLGIDDAARRISLSFRMFNHFAVQDETRGWILLRTMPLVGTMNADMKAFVHSEFSDAIAQGRCKVKPSTVMTDMGLGLLIMTINRLLTERCGDADIDRAAEALLIAMGLSPKEAKSIATEPIDFENFPPVKQSCSDKIS